MTATTAHQMQTALFRHFSPRAALVFEISSDLREEQIMVGGMAHPWHRRRRIDALMIQKARKQGIGPLEVMAIEIKVSRADFLADAREPAKQAPWREVAHRHAYAVPAGLVRRDEVPAGSGLIEIGAQDASWHDVRWAVRAPWTETPDIPSWLTLALAYRMSQAEGSIRGLRADGEQSAESLRADLLNARKQIRLLSAKYDRAADAAERWRTAFAATGGLPCRWCRKPVRPKNVAHGALSAWLHVQAADEPACAEIRARDSRWAQPQPADDPDLTEGVSA